MRQTLMCFAHGRDDDWEAICVDLDIAVAGQSFEEVRETLSDAIRSYIEDALVEEPVAREALLNRRAPLLVTLQHLARVVMTTLRGSRRAREEIEVPFGLPCPV